MKKITVISGKGGTGKTTVTANLALLAGDLILADCDVDAPNLHLLLKPEQLKERVFISGKLAVKDDDKCLKCGRCLELCRFRAISASLEIKPLKCEGCGLCAEICPAEAIELVDQDTGKIFIARTRYGPMVHARLKAGADNSGKLVSEVRKEADNLAGGDEAGLILIDGSPGIGCPVIASLNGVDLALIVTEPTKSGLSDLKRIIEVTEHFRIPAAVVINKYDINERICGEIESYCRGKKLSSAGRIPFEGAVNDALRSGRILLEYNQDCRAAAALREIWQNISDLLKTKSAI